MIELCGRCGHQMKTEDGNHVQKPCPKTECPCQHGIRADVYLNIQMAQLVETVRACANCGHGAHPNTECAAQLRQTKRDQNGIPVIGTAESCGCPVYVPILQAISECLFRIVSTIAEGEESSADTITTH